MNAFRNITKTIRLSNIFKMNDTSEVMHALEFLQSALVEEYNNNPFPFNYKEIDNSRAFARIVSDIKRKMNEVTYFSYIASFSDSENDLGQWNMYGDDGKGVAIGYDGKILYDISKQCSLIMTAVHYSAEEHKRFMKVITPRIIDDIKNAGNHGKVKNGIDGELMETKQEAA
jgi:hypothetical protein